MKSVQHGHSDGTKIKAHIPFKKNLQIAFRHFYLLSRKLNPICTNGLYPACNKQIF